LKERIKLIVYILTIIFITSIHNPIVYLLLFLIAVSISADKFVHLFKKTLKSIIIFNLIISLSYAIYTFVVSKVDFKYLIMINLRVLLITYLTFYLIEVCNIFSAVSFSKNLSYLLVLAYSQIMNFKRVYMEMQLAFRSRVLAGDRKKYLSNFSQATVGLFLTKSMYNACELAEGMKSRGFFNDRA